MKIANVSGVLLAGGQSRRMGQDKRLVLVDGVSLFQRVLSIFEQVFTETIVVVAQHSSVTEGLSHRVVTDVIPGKGPVGGLHTGLFYSREPFVFLAACDMPFLEIALIQRICQLSKESDNADACMFELSTGIQPMQGVYSQKCISSLESMIRNDQLSMQGLLNRTELKVQTLDQAKIEDLDPNFVSFMNINTPSDLEMANKLCRK